MDEKAFYDRMKQYGNILFLCHKNADVDSLGSAYALMRLFGGTIGVEDSLSTMAEMLAGRLKVRPLIGPDPAQYGLTVVVDTSSLVQTGYHRLEHYAVIDHHEPGDLLDACQFSFVKRAPSTAELVFGICERNGVRPDTDMVFALLLAIVTDTGHFRYAHAGTFEAVSRLLEEGDLPFSSVLDFLAQVPTDISSRIAMLKAASRMAIVREGEHLIVTTKVGSFGAQAAASLVSLGADVAFAGSEIDHEVRISGRVRRGVELDLAALLNEVGKRYGGSGGGHAAAAGLVLKGNVDIDKALQECVDRAIACLSAPRRNSPQGDRG